ncbi:LysR family transcriptional regulator ArgP [Flaviflagellibacter deserti]|uniref:LysR family transcriptional regulator ArgP n=1 Tax=Flaviflagellibacter deserti TaxID=2267266 RepID=A0ABV9Z0D4_9HYPH
MIDYAQLAALAAVVRTGSFEKAAEHLNVTPSAISQRVKLLEERSGQVLVIRGQPCTATPAGARLCRHAQEVSLLEHGLRDDLRGVVSGDTPVTIRIAVNADSLATWFIPAMAAVDGLLFDVVLDDQDHSAEWLKRGDVSAALTSVSHPIQGCGSRSLGALRYRATANPDFVRRWFPEGVTEDALRRAPCLSFNEKDELQARWLKQVFGRRITTPVHWLPSSQAFVDAALAGLGWGMNPEHLAGRHLRAGDLVEIVPGQPQDVGLFWQWSRAVEPAVKPLTEAVVAAARAALVQV